MIFKKLFFIIVLFFIGFSATFAHDFDSEAFSYMLSHPDATYTEFETYILDQSNGSTKEALQNIDTKLEAVLSLPGKKYLVNYTQENPNFTYSDIKELIQDDPMLSEIGSEVIYSFLHRALQSEKSFMSFDFFIRTVYLGFTHILGGLDHMLFIFTLIVCLPRSKRILIIASTFTLAHSLTILLGGLGIFTLSSDIVEPAITFSIILMGVYAIFQKVGEEKSFYPEIILIFTLGLFHGLGFSGFFLDILGSSDNIILPVLGFNLGVELGQILVISVSMTGLYFLYKFFPKQKEYIKNILMGLTIIIACYFLFQLLA